MIKRFLVAGVLLAVFYTFFLMTRLHISPTNVEKKVDNFSEQSKDDMAPSQKVYSFSFSKYTTEGHREIEIEGDSADIFAKDVILSNVIAKAYANEKPITITADKGVFDKSNSNIHLHDNVVATSEDGAILRSESLDIDITNKALATEDEAQIERGNITLEGKGASGNANDRRMQFNKNVTVVISNEESSQSTVITCDGLLEVNYADNVAHFNKNVVAIDERGKLTSDYMDVFYNKNSKRVSRIVARGNVVIEQDGNVTYSDNVVYLADEGRVLLGGDPEAVYYQNSGDESKVESESNSDSSSIDALFN